jgi:hypothetical protein
MSFRGCVGGAHVTTGGLHLEYVPIYSNRRASHAGSKMPCGRPHARERSVEQKDMQQAAVRVHAPPLGQHSAAAPE